MMAIIHHHTVDSATSNNMLAFSTVLILLLVTGLDCADETQRNEVYGSPGNFGSHPLIIKMFPAVANYQSDLYEVYAEPYTYDVPSGGEYCDDTYATYDEVSYDGGYDSDGDDLRAATAVAIVQGEGETALKGEILFLQQSPPAGPVLVRGNITDLPAGKHGFHIAQAGDLRQGCEKLGGHFNPYLLQHGGPSDPLRHVGDLGNLEAKEDGTVEFEFVDPLLSLSGGLRGIVGRAVVITSDPDDLGRGGTPDSALNGNSGKPLACGVIAFIK